MTLEEFEIAGTNHDDVGLDWDAPGFERFGNWVYTMKSIGPALIDSAQLSITQSATVVPPSPCATSIAGRQGLIMIDVMPAQSDGSVQDLHNGFTAAVPEPSTSTLMIGGRGILVFGARRHRG